MNTIDICFTSTSFLSSPGFSSLEHTRKLSSSDQFPITGFDQGSASLAREAGWTLGCLTWQALWSLWVIHGLLGLATCPGRPWPTLRPLGCCPGSVSLCWPLLCFLSRLSFRSFLPEVAGWSWRFLLVSEIQGLCRVLMSKLSLNYEPSGTGVLCRWC